MPAKKTYLYGKCGSCSGIGVIHIDDGTLNGQDVSCSACSGTGQVKLAEIKDE